MSMMQADVRCLLPVLVGCLLLPSCFHDEDKASRTLETFLEAELEGDRERAWELISTADKRVRTKAEYINVDPVEDALREKYAAVVAYEVTSVIVHNTIEAEAVVRATGPDLVKLKQEGLSDSGEPPLKEEFHTYILVLEGEEWRVDMGWATPSLEEVASLLSRFFDPAVLFKEPVELGHKALDTWKDTLEAGKEIAKTFNPPPTALPEPKQVPPKAENPPPSRPTTPEVPNDPKPGQTEPEQKPDVEKPEAPEAQPEEEDAGEWEVERGQNPMTDAETATLRVLSEHTIGELVPRTPELMIRCEGSQLTISADVHTLVNSNFGSFHRATVYVRLGNQAAKRTWVHLSKAHQVLSFDRPKQWLSKMQKHDGEELRIEFMSPIDKKHVVRFNLTGISSAMRSVPSACLR